MKGITSSKPSDPAEAASIIGSALFSVDLLFADISLQSYFKGFKASKELDRPNAAAGVNVFAADSDQEARRLFTSAQQQFTNMLRGKRGKLPPPIDDIEAYWTASEKAQASSMLSCSFVGTRETVRAGLEAFVEETRVQELIIASAIFDHSARRIPTN